MADAIQVMTTTAAQADAEQVARAVLEARLAACVQIIGPLTSLYWWQGEIEQAEEWLCLIKTRADVFADLERAIRSVHPYEVPEIIALPVAAGSADYLTWLNGEVRRRTEK
jgi:periplasmic divalent cation tolerance protein